ncbi:MAG: bifunctional UDP-N-acetylmuramoyl-tripeptide:D-alanyl-D-alanine ligase/alanine racemase [Bacteroidales bacterium]|jgi:alanine racemase|nr:bifunctional UDP-N-acetylmuramoyl-tripeptide:D-alanyl-D-alanine ligase/alanine racemase [Bacteroidales bacterium]
MTLHPCQIAEIVGGTIINNCNNVYVSEYLTDSRLLLFPAKTVFFAIKTDYNDGHFYIDELYQKGVRAFVIANPEFPFFDYDEAVFIVVENVVEALQNLAIFHRLRLTSKIVGITGSNGKTIVKEWLKQILERQFYVAASPKSYNSQIGVPLSIFQADDNHNIAIFEAGISCPGEMQRLQKMIRPNVGIITNIGDAHGENFTSQHEKLQEKLVLFSEAEVLIYNSDQKELSNVVADFSNKHGIKTFSWGNSEFDNLQIFMKKESQDHVFLQAAYHNRTFSLELPFTDQVSIENAMHCFAAALCCNMKTEDIVEEMKFLQPVALRLELHRGINGCAIINDSYNLDVESLKSALDFLQHQNGYAKKTLILSDIFQSKKSGNILYQDVADLIAEKNINRFIGIGDALYEFKSLFPGNALFFESTEQFIQNARLLCFENELILLKGARHFQFEKISRILRQHTHETTLEINLNAVAHNFKYFRSKAKQAKVMAMVKASAYGSGSEEIANVLQFYGADYLVVAYTDEGVALRKAKITIPIMVINPENESFDDIIAYNLEPEIYSFRSLDLFEKAVKRHLFYQSTVVRFHIKLDTGMRRLGFMQEDIPELIKRLKKLKNSRVVSVFSHFAGSDDPVMDDFSQMQIERFEAMSKEISDSLDYSILRHINNSAAIVRFPLSRFDMVRLGIGLYGISSNEEEQLQLLPVNRLLTVVSQIKNVPKGDYIGYNQGFKAERDITIAILPIGYADGLPRSLKNRGKVWLNGTLCSMIGNICMDMCMIDISNVHANEGDQVEIFGINQSLHAFSAQAGTIPYEILTGISPRVKRIYVQE